MDARTREYLRIIISVALTVAPRAIKRAYLERPTEEVGEARRRLSGSVADAVLQHFDVAEKPDRLGVSASSRFMGDRRRD